MALLSTSNIKATGSFGMGIFWKIWFYILLVTFIILATKAVALSVQEHSWDPAIEFMGNRIVTPTLTLGESSQSIIDNGLFYKESGHFFVDIYNNLLNYSTIVFAIVAIVFYLKIFAWIAMKTLLWNDSMSTSSYVVGFILMLTAGMGVLYYRNEDPFSLFLSFWTFIKAIWSIF